MTNEILQARPWQAYGLTVEQFREIQKKQIDDTMPKVPANNARPQDFTSEAFRNRYAGFRIPAVDQMFYHVAIRRIHYNEWTGVDESTFAVQVYNQETYAALTNREAFGGSIDGFTGMQSHILHIPKKHTG